MKRYISSFIAITLLACASAAQAQPTTYQGKLLDGGVPATGPLDLLFRLYDVSAGGTQQGPDLTILGFNDFAADGTFVVDLDFGPGVFTGNDRWLEVSVNGAPLSPRQPLRAAPYAIYALNGGTNGWTNKGAQIHTMASVGIGTTNPLAGLHIYGSQPTIRLEHSAGDSYSEFKDGTTQQLRINKVNNAGGVLLDINPKPENHTSNAQVRFFRETDTTGPKYVQFLRGDFSTSESARIGVDGENSFFQMHGGNFGIGTSNPLGLLHVAGAVPFVTIQDTNSTGAEQAGFVSLRDSAGTEQGWFGYGTTTNTDMMFTNLIGDVVLRSNSHRLTLAGDGNVGIGTSSPVARLHVMQTGSIGMRVQNGPDTLDIAQNSINTEGDGFFGDPLLLNNAVAQNVLIGLGGGNTGIGTAAAQLPVVKLHVDGGGDASLASPSGGSLMVGSVAGANIIMDNNEIMARNDGAQSTLYINNEGGDVRIGQNGGTSTVYLPVLTITGGADLSEMFDVGGEEQAAPGTVVVIDPDNPGRLIPSTSAYDAKVAGIISGAGGVATGMRMGHDGTIADGEHPVALSGRVYCYMDATEFGISPGDMLTTSDTPGHAMKVIDRDRAQGAVIGKAMTGLEQGETGLVLVLVTLQ